MKKSEKINDKNMPHFNRYSQERAIQDTRRVYRRVFAGDMATIGREDSRAAGYPIGSVTPFIIDHTGSPVIFTADVAEHTKNAFDNGKASLMMRQVERQHQIETGWRLTCIGDLEKLEGDDEQRVAESYFRFYPEADKYAGVHKFCFLRLNIAVARVIMGFGKISWIEAEDFVIPSPFTREEETRIIEHMNDDHQAALFTYLKSLRVEVDESLVAPRMVSVNQFGAVVDYHHHLYFVEFDEPAETVDQARQQLVKLAKP